jgi:hypothetical protein
MLTARANASRNHSVCATSRTHCELPLKTPSALRLLPAARATDWHPIFARCTMRACEPIRSGSRNEPRGSVVGSLAHEPACSTTRAALASVPLRNLRFILPICVSFFRVETQIFAA